MDYNARTHATEYADAPPVYKAATGMGGVVQVANLLFAIVIVVALLMNHTSAVMAIIVGGLYYGVTTHSVLLILSGTLSDIVRIRSEHRTTRRLHELQYTLYSPPAAPLPEPDPEPLPEPPKSLPSNFVPAYQIDESEWTEARAWLVQLFDLRSGLPDPAKVLGDESASPGRIRCKLPSKNATQYLLDRQILRPVKGGNRLNPRFPTRKEALEAFDSTPVPPSRGGGYTQGGRGS